MGPEIWCHVQGRLSGHPHLQADLGFSGTPFTPVACLPVVITHSLGLMWALHNIPRPWAGLVAINGFTRFTQTSGFPGVAPSVLARMQSRLSENMPEVVALFLQRCGIETPFAGGFVASKLGDGLAWLSEWDARAQLSTVNFPVLALCGTADPIVSVAHSCACFPESMRVMVEGGGHVLPLTHAPLIALHVDEICTRLWKH